MWNRLESFSGVIEFFILVALTPLSLGRSHEKDSRVFCILALTKSNYFICVYMLQYLIAEYLTVFKFTERRYEWGSNDLQLRYHSVKV